MLHILHVNHDALAGGGASIAVIRIHNALLNAGIDSQIICPCHPHALHTIQWPRGGKRHFMYWFLRAQNACLYYFIGHKYSINLVSRGISAQVNRLNPDIVHLHWLQADTMSIEEIGKIRKPVLWSLHDLWPMAGVDAYPENDWYKTGYPKSALWIDRWVWIRKKKAIQKASVSAVVASQWLLREVQTSLAFAGQRVYHVPLALHPCYIVPSANDMTIRTGDDRCIILFGSTSGVKSRVKGFDRLSRALSLVSEAIRPYLEVSVFGSTGEDFQIAGVPVHFLGPVPSPEMPAVFRKADIFAFPSRYETCGQVKLEALACGVPVVAFDESACAEEILHRETGWVAAPGDCADFARGIEWAYAVSKNPAQRMMCSAKARESMIRLHAPEAVAQKMIEVYKHVLAKQ